MDLQSRVVSPAKKATGFRSASSFWIGLDRNQCCYYISSKCKSRIQKNQSKKHKHITKQSLKKLRKAIVIARLFGRRRRHDYCVSPVAHLLWSASLQAQSSLQLTKKFHACWKKRRGVAERYEVSLDDWRSLGFLVLRTRLGLSLGLRLLGC